MLSVLNVLLVVLSQQFNPVSACNTDLLGWRHVHELENPIKLLLPNPHAFPSFLMNFVSTYPTSLASQDPMIISSRNGRSKRMWHLL